MKTVFAITVALSYLATVASGAEHRANDATMDTKSEQYGGGRGYGGGGYGGGGYGGRGYRGYGGRGY